MLLDLFKERLGEERANQILQEAVGKTYEELLEERDELAARVEELEAENERLRKIKDPVLEAVEELSEVADELEEEVNKHGTNWLIKQRVEREHREGIPLEGIEIVEG